MSAKDSRFESVLGRQGADGRLWTADVDYSTGGGGGGGRDVVLRPLPLVCDGVGGASGAALGHEARASEASLVLDAGERGGNLGAKGVARVVSDRLLAMRQPLRAG